MTTRAYFLCLLALLAVAANVPVRAARAHKATNGVAVRTSGVDIRAVRLWAGPDNTRVVLDLSGSAQHSLTILKNPDRVVLDVAGAELSSGARAIPVAGVVRQVRMARRPSGEMRFVFDLAHPVRAKSFLTRPNEHYGYRLVIDLGGGGEGAGVGNAIAPSPERMLRTHSP